MTKKLIFRLMEEILTTIENGLKKMALNLIEVAKNG